MNGPSPSPVPAVLTPAARALADALTAGFPVLGPGTDAAAVRRAIARPPARLPALASVTDRTIPGPAGAPPLPVRIYRPYGPPHGRARAEPGRSLPLVLFFHGGGFVLCGLDSHDGLCRLLAAGTGAVVVSVDYRLAPEHPAPAAVRDARAAFDWAVRHAASLGCDPARIAVAGDSSGGNLATSVCLAARDRGGPRPAAQLLIYPALDPRLDTASMRDFGEGHFLTAAAMRWYWERYLGGAEPTAEVAPALAEDTGGLPPALLVEAECDPLRDEGRAYAARLDRVEIHRARGMFHGFIDFADELPEAAAAQERAVAWLRERLGIDGTPAPGT
ncbi:alpha/beta hydrolase [Streptomyces rubradiris]|uniref:alpha/beta hydrolase n=1 Tax=Streptomyces rubradiris TaxID=285531 RepID=UPI0033D4B98E